MLSRREKLLVRPWQQRRFENHRRKVQSALPAIDATPPKSREHVLFKRKKQQYETERSVQIEKENLLLLRRMGYIMKTNRVDNYWSTPPPNFLNRVHLYEQRIPEKDEVMLNDKRLEHIVTDSSNIRRTKCIACTPQEFTLIEIPEERIPWEPPKQCVSLRLRSKSLPSRPPPMEEKPIEVPSKAFKRTKQPEKLKGRSKSSRTREESNGLSNVNSLILTRGALKLYVNFPPDTRIKLQDGAAEKIISRGLCQCNNTRKYLS